MTKKLIIRRRRDRGLKGDKGDQGERGPAGPRGKKGEPGDDAFETWLEENPEGTWTKWLAELRGPRGHKGDRGPTGFGGQGPPGPPGPGSEPVSVSLTRDDEDRVETVTPEGEPTLSIERAVDGSVSGLSSSEKVFTVNRDSEGRVTGVTVADA